MKKVFLGAIALALTVSFSSFANAGLEFADFVRTGDNEIQDESREYLIDRNVTVQGQIDVGDSLRAFFNFNAFNSPGSNVGGVTGNNQITGVSQIMVIAKSPTVNGVTSYVFGPDPAFEAQYGAGAMVALYEDPNPTAAFDFNDPNSPLAPNAIDDGTPGRSVPPSSADVSSGLYATEEAFGATLETGSLVMTLGFEGAAGEAWLATTLFGFDNILAAFSTGFATTGALFNVGVNVLTNNLPDTIIINRVKTGFIGGAPGGLVDFNISGRVGGVNDLDTAFEASNQFVAAFNATVVPEPSSVAIWGLGGLGLLAFGRRRIRRNKKS